MKHSKSMAIFSLSVGLLAGVSGISLHAKETSLVPEPRGVLTSNSPEDKVLQDNDSHEESRESEREKEVNILNYGLDTDIIAMLDEFIANKTFHYLEELDGILRRTRSVALREKIIMYFTEAKDNRLADYALEIIEDPFDTRNSTVSLMFKYVSAVKVAEAGPLARALLEEEYMEYFEGALTALADVGTAEDAQFLAEYINREELSIGQQQSVMKALGRLKAVETWDALVDIAQNEDKNTFVRMYASEAIGAMEKPESVEVLAYLYESTDPNLRASVIKGIAHYPNDATAQAIIIEGIKDSHYKVRLESIKAVKDNKMQSAAAHIVFRAKNDPETAVKYACFETIGILGDTDGIKYLQDLVKEKYAGDTAKVKASEALLAHGSSSALDSVVTLARESLADDKKKNLRYALGKVFAAQENAGFAEICGEYLAHKDVATVGTGLDIYARNKFPSITQTVREIADGEKASSNRTKARKILDRE